MRRSVGLAGVLAVAVSFTGQAADPQLPQLTCCTSGEAGGLSQGAGDAIADEEVVRGDVSGLQGSTWSLTDAGVLTCAAGQLNLDNLRLDGNTLSSTDANGAVTIDPNGTGVVQMGVTTAPVRIDAYGARTDASNYLRLTMDAGTNYGSFELAQAGTGNGANVLYVSNKNTAGGANLELQTAGVTRMLLTSSGLFVQSAQSATCADSGDANPGTLSLQPTLPLVYVTNSDAHGCTVTMSETNPSSGATVQIVIVSSAGGTVDFADTSGVSELAGAFTMDLYDTLRLVYVTDRWIELSRSNN